MKEKELRLALVYYGGVSLAIYQHGVNVEILNLLRASKAYHAQRNSALRQADAHRFHRPLRDAGSTGVDEPVSTEPVYFDLLKQIGQSLDLRVIADVISGSSAGGINGIVLARAITHDLSIEPLTDLWLREADLVALISPEARASRWSKWYFTPVLRLVFRYLEQVGILPRHSDPEIRRRISTFVRSRWFKPPFDGPHFTGLLLDGLMAMEDTGHAGSTLLPPEMRLDLAITVTDYHGAEKVIFLHDPPGIREREHRQILRFSAVRSSSGLTRSDFDLPDVPSLAFAARASASYPGAFPPAQIREVDQMVAQRGLDWSGRDQFLAANFAHYRQFGLEPEDVVLLDGSILNNKPLQAAIDAIRTHNAYREVDRRLVYIDPHPERTGPGARMGVPGFFATLRGALSDLPRHDPIYEELEATSRLNDQVRRLKAIALVSRPHVEDLIEKATAGGLSRDFSVEHVRHWRLMSTNLLSSSALTYNAWMRSLVLESVDVICGLVNHACKLQPLSQSAQWIRRVIEAWCDMAGMFPPDYVIPETVNVDVELPSFGRFIVDFGVRYKARRIAYVIQAINGIYHMAPESLGGPVDPEKLDELKRKVGDGLHRLYELEDPQFLLRLPIDRISALFCAPDSGLRAPPADFAQARQTEITQIIADIGKVCGLVGTNEELDDLLSSPLITSFPSPVRRIILSNYLGWPYADVVILPAMNALGLQSNALEEVLVDRISPQDASSVCDHDCGHLQGETAIGFGGFLSRSSRESDYLWGRIHAIDRLIDIVASTISSADMEMPPDFAAFKKRAFEAMLQGEMGRLENIPDLLATVQAKVKEL